ncbi:MAG: HD-GYP domain-containing protein [Thermoleophilia bacterium]|nr:HD-GYP domain-containing protein [Thermoleophilia bacterium]
MIGVETGPVSVAGGTAGALALLAAAGAPDPYTAAHSRRVRRLALALGEELELRPDELVALGHAALFHDIGKLAVPAEILLKPARLDEAEWVLMRRHSADGAELAGSLGLHRDAVPAIRHHHERFDGGGYPDGLAGEAIPLAARIIHVADALDSMLTTRPYRSGRPARAALTELRREAGAQFCPRCVAALERLIGGGALADLGLPPASLIAPVA